MVTERGNGDTFPAGHFEDGLSLFGLNSLIVYGQGNHTTTSFITSALGSTTMASSRQTSKQAPH
jgi:hypothetical protein